MIIDTDYDYFCALSRFEELMVDADEDLYNELLMLNTAIEEYRMIGEVEWVDV